MGHLFSQDSFHLFWLVEPTPWPTIEGSSITSPKTHRPQPISHRKSLESNVDDNCVGDGRDGVGLGFPETHRFVVKFCHSDGMTGS